MAEQTNEIILVNAKWSNDVGAYVAKIDGRTAIINLSDSVKSATSKTAPAEQATSATKPNTRRGKPAKKAAAKTVEPAGEASVVAAKPTKAKSAKAKRQRSPSLSAEQESEVLGLISAGKSKSEILALVPGSTIGIVGRLKRVAAAKPVKSPKAKAKPAAKAAAKKPGKRAKVAPAA